MLHSWGKIENLTNYELERMLRLNCVRIAGCNVVAFMTLGSQSRNCYSVTLVRQLPVQKFMATIFCKIWVQILLCVKLISYTVSILAILDRTVPRSPSYSDHHFLFSFSNLCGQRNSPHCRSRSRNWFRNLPSENKRKIEILAVILGKFLDVLCQI